VFEADEALVAADQRLLEEAESAATQGPFSVVDKEATPPSGDPHDYLSHGPYWWPDPGQADGLPYFRRDGESNPDRELHDRQALAAMLSAVHTLAAAYFFSDHERFAERAGLLLRAWFLDPSTRMNPHLEFAQGIPGRCDGRGIGIIDTSHFTFLPDSVGLLAASRAWSAEDQQGLEAWFSQLVAWLTESEYGRDEGQQPNNHATWYDAQVLALALFTGNDAIGLEVARRARSRIDTQIEADGSQPCELRRTKALSYSVMNLTGFFNVADLCTHHDMDLWSHQAQGGGSLRGALDWLVECAIDSEWIHPQIEPFEPTSWVPLLRRACLRFDEPAYEDRLQRLPGVDAAADFTNLFHPLPA
jgi:hypothetical protein